MSQFTKCNVTEGSKHSVAPEEDLRVAEWAVTIHSTERTYLLVIQLHANTFFEP